MQNPTILILAAGKGTRMQSTLPKVLHPLAGRPLLHHVIATAQRLKPKRILVVVGYGAAEVKKAMNGFKVGWILQKRQLGTADAVRVGLRQSGLKTGPLLILSGDVPLLGKRHLDSLMKEFEKTNASLTIITTDLKNPAGYGRVIRNGTGEVSRIIEEREASDKEKEIQEINAGIYMARVEEILKPIQAIQPSHLKKEYYLTDLVEMLLKDGRRVTSVKVTESEACLGINNQEQLVAAEELLRKNINQNWIKRGVILKNPDTISIGLEVKIEPGAVIHQGVLLEGKSVIKQGAVILPYTVVEDSVVRKGARVGPFAHLRPGSDVGDEAHVGNYVELKKTTLKKGAKANHLSYLGDSIIGERANVGAGTITCNYDGIHKHPTRIGKGAFTGSNSTLVAPLRIGDGAYIAAGSTITEDVPSGALAFGRARQITKKGHAKRLLKKRKK